MKRAIVVAHSDDEVLWAGGLSLRYPGDWTIICCSTPVKEMERVAQFAEACAVLGAKSKLYPDEDISGKIPLKFLDQVDLEEFDHIVTHNKWGEYGHSHHKQVHAYVMSKYRHKRLTTFGFRLWGFKILGRLRLRGKGAHKIVLTVAELEQKMSALKKYTQPLTRDGKVIPLWQDLINIYCKKKGLNLAAIKSLLPQAKMLQWNVDWLVPEGQALSNDPTSQNNKQKLLSKRDFLDATFLTTAGPILNELSTPRHIAAFLPNPVDPSIERGRNFEITNLPHDVFFPSNSEDDRRFHCGAWRSMGDFTRDMQKALPDISFLTPGINNVPKVFGPAYQEAICQCAIGLNISRRNDSYLYSSDRLAHLAGNGLAVCIDRATGYADIFTDDEMVFYSNEEELFSRLAALKRDDAKRRRIARDGWKRYGELFDSRIIAQYMLDIVYGAHDAAKYTWPTVTKKV